MFDRDILASTKPALAETLAEQLHQPLGFLCDRLLRNPITGTAGRARHERLDRHRIADQRDEFPPLIRSPRRRGQVASPREDLQGAHRVTAKSQLVEQRPGAVEVGRVKALRKPVIDRREHIKSLLEFATLSPKPGERSARPQFKHLCALVGSDLDRPAKGRSGFLAGVVGRVQQQQFATLAFDFGIAPALKISLCNLSRFGPEF